MRRAATFMRVTNRPLTFSFCCALVLCGAACEPSVSGTIAPSVAGNANSASAAVTTSPQPRRAAVTPNPSPTPSAIAPLVEPQPATGAQPSTAALSSAAYLAPVRLAMLADKAIDESSGLVASRVNPSLLWTHNDSGNAPLLYLIDRQGRTRRKWRIASRLVDWEDIAAARDGASGRTYLYAGDIGDNAGRRNGIVVYRFPEPSLAASGDAKRVEVVEVVEAIRLRYPDGARDAETLLIHPQSGDLYIVTKQALAPAEVYRATAPLDAERTTTLERIAIINIPGLLGGFITGGDIAPDGRRVVLSNYVAGYEFTLPDGENRFDRIWQQQPLVITLNPRRQGEAICYRLDGRAVLTTSEGLPTPLDEMERAGR